MTLLVLDRGRETQSCDRLRLPTSAVGDGSPHPLILSALHLFILLGCLLLCLCCDCQSVCNITFAMRSRLFSVWFVEVRRGWYLKTKTIFTRKLLFFFNLFSLSSVLTKNKQKMTAESKTCWLFLLLFWWRWWFVDFFTHFSSKRLFLKSLNYHRNPNFIHLVGGSVFGFEPLTSVTFKTRGTHK